jgi:hypothetical protein
MSDVDRPAVSRPLLIGLGAVVVIAVLWLFVIGPRMGGGDDVVVAPVPTRAPLTPAPSPLPDDDSLYPESSEVFSARDPFAQLVAAEAEAGVGAVPTPGNVAPIPGGGTPGTGGAGPSDSPSPGRSGGGGAPRAGSSAEVGGTEIKLIDVYDEATRAVVTVNGRSYDVAEGEPFAQRFRLLDLTGECGTFLFGDSRFVLCEGDEIRK